MSRAETYGDPPVIPRAAGPRPFGRRVGLFAAAVALVAAGCYERPGILWEPGADGKLPRVRTVAELSERYDSEHCGECHAEIYGQWKNSIHSRSIVGTGRTTGSLQTTLTNGLMAWLTANVADTPDVKVEHLMGCAKCHLPQLSDAEDNVAREVAADIIRWAEAKDDKDEKTQRALEAKLSSLNIGCLVCHNQKAVVHKWADGYPLPRAVYGSKGEKHFCGIFPRAVKSPIMGESIFCGQCHGLGPNFEVDNPTQCATAYGSYLFSYKAKGGAEECQDCHMRKFGQGHDIQSYRDPRLIKAALDFSLGASAARVLSGNEERDGVVARVVMVNRAGHSIPDG